MAAISLAEGAGELDLAAFAEYVQRELPPFARPVFLRLQANMALTGTYKLVKGDLRREGYDVAAADDPMFVMKPGAAAYEPLDADYLATIRAGEAGF